jgi:ABC-type sugar transport system permease subunit
MSFGVDRSITFGHDAKRMATVSSRPAPIAWLLAPALLLFVLFFVLPFGVMAVMSFFSSNPVTNHNTFLTTRHYERFIFDRPASSTMRCGPPCASV